MIKKYLHLPMAQVSQYHMPTKTTDQIFQSLNELIAQAARTCHIQGGLTGKVLIRRDVPRFS